MSVWDAVAAPIIAIINKVVPDKAAAAAAVASLNEMQMEGRLSDELAQLQALTINQSVVDTKEAASPSMFVAGWRPAVGWICAAALGMQFLFAPCVTWVSALCGHPLTFPTLDTQTLMTLLFGMLGLGAYRSFEKVKGVDTTDVGK
jgi:hypothetical protein